MAKNGQNVQMDENSLPEEAVGNLAAFTNEAKKYPPLSEEEEAVLANKALSGVKGAKDELYDHSLHYVVETGASCKDKTDVPSDNLAKEGNRALVAFLGGLTAEQAANYRASVQNAIESALSSMIEARENAVLSLTEEEAESEIEEADDSFGEASFKASAFSPTASTDSYQLYLHYMSQYKRISPERELELGRVIQRGFAENATEEEKEAGLKAKNDLMNANLRLVIYVAVEYKGKGVPVLDLIQEGNLGLSRAAEKFNPEYGFRFSTYATPWIRQAIARGLADQGHTIRIPSNKIAQVSKIHQVQAQLEGKLGREPTIEEIDEAMPEYDADEINALLQIPFSVASTSQPLSKGDPDSAELGDWIAGEDDPVEEADKSDLPALVERSLACIDGENAERDKKIMVMLFGLYGQEECSLETVAKAMNLTRERVRQIREACLRKMRKSLIEEAE